MRILSNVGNLNRSNLNAGNYKILSGKLQNLSGKLQNLSGKLQKLSGKLQICGKLQINVSKNVKRISINHKITQEI